MKLNAKQLRESYPAEKDLKEIKRRQTYIILDNILDTYNTGSIFRLADAVAVNKIYLCGKTQTPPYHRIAKAAVGTEKWVPWEYASTAVEAMSNVKCQMSNVKIIAIEQSKRSVDFKKVDYREPIVFVVGNETEGVSKEALALADTVVEIPMFGVNKSLNVMVSLAIVLYQAITRNNKQ